MDVATRVLKVRHSRTFKTLVATSAKLDSIMSNYFLYFFFVSKYYMIVPRNVLKKSDNVKYSIFFMKENIHLLKDTEISDVKNLSNDDFDEFGDEITPPVSISNDATFYKCSTAFCQKYTIQRAQEEGDDDDSPRYKNIYKSLSNFTVSEDFLVIGSGKDVSDYSHTKNNIISA